MPVLINSLGQRVLGDGGKVRIGADGDPCCCGYECLRCGSCCYSSKSIGRLTWDLNNVTSYHHAAGAVFDDSVLSGSVDLPFNGGDQIGAWHNFSSGGTGVVSFVGRQCVTSGGISAGVWFGPDGTPFGVNYYPRYIVFIGGYLSGGNCNGGSWTGVTLSIQQQNADGSFYRQAKGGTGSVVIEIINNKCCQCAGGNCSKTSDGTTSADDGACTSSQDDNCPP